MPLGGLASSGVTHTHTLPPIWLPDALTDGVITLDGHRLADAEAHLAGEDAEMRLRFAADQPSAS